ncbi:hypothetical protein AB4Z48_35590 [Cupriavidus sp. 2TAF22]|uniref:hypothetical protein n=1 Tax=unclassified Cupriavidus TaxID=2640874 RepID=UPI003F904947
MPFLQGVQAELRAAGMQYLSVQIPVMLALALHSAGQHAEAVQAMRAALAYGQKGLGNQNMTGVV